MAVSKKRIVILLVFIMNAQVFSATATNPLGINGAQEAFYVFLGLWALISVVRKQLLLAKVPSIDLFVLVTPFVLMAYGATAAFVTFGQPLAFGVLEERRIFSIYVYFPVIDLLRSGKLSAEKMEKTILVVMVICAALMFAVSFDLLPTWNEVRNSNIALRTERLSIGSSFSAAFLPLLLVRLRGKDAIKWIWLFLFIAAALIYITQSRQLLIGLALLIVLTLRTDVLVALGATLAVAVFVFLPTLSDQIRFYYELFSALTSEQYLETSWRALGIGEVIRSQSAGEIYGHGALSLMWNDGFHRVVGDFFFLADIGIFGTLYRYGLVGFFWYLVWGTVQLRLLQRMPAGAQRRCYSAVLIFLIILIPVAAPLEYRGFVTGPLLAMTAFLGLQRNTEKAARSGRLVTARPVSATP